MKQPALFDTPPVARELDSPARSFQRETAMERRWRQRREEKQREAEQAERRAIGEIEHDERWCRPTNGYRVDVIRDGRLT